MIRSIRDLVHEARRHLLHGFNRLIHRSDRSSSSNRNYFSNKLRSGDSLIGQLRPENLKESLSTQPQEINIFYTNGGGDPGSPSIQARTRRAKNRFQVLNRSSSHLMVRQVVSLLKQVGLTLHVVAEDRLTATWPTETNLDCFERQDPLVVEMQISNEKGVKFRRLTGPENLFRSRVHDILMLIHEHCDW